MEWLQEAGLVTEEQVSRWVRAGNRMIVVEPIFFGRGKIDPVGESEVANIPQDAIVGFFAGDHLLYTIISHGNGSLAGVRGQNVGAKSDGYEVVNLQHAENVVWHDKTVEFPATSYLV